MNELEVLKEKIELLQKIVDTQAALISEMRKFTPMPQVSIPSQWQVVGSCQHEYPSPWFGIIPPSCKKCGQQGLGYTITSNDTIVL